MPRTDENGRQLKALLDYLLDGDVEAKHIYDALRTSSSTYYRRIKEADYPHAEELRLVADRFGLSYPDLQIRFGLMSQQEVRSYLESAPVAVAGRVPTAVEAGIAVQTGTAVQSATAGKTEPGPTAEIATDPLAAAPRQHDHRPGRRRPLAQLSPRPDAPPL